MPQPWTTFAPFLEMLLAGTLIIYIFKNLRSVTLFWNLLTPALRVCFNQICRLVFMLQAQCHVSDYFMESTLLGCMTSPRCSGCESVCSLQVSVFKISPVQENSVIFQCSLLSLYFHYHHFRIAFIIIQHLLIASHIPVFVSEVKDIKTNKMFLPLNKLACLGASSFVSPNLVTESLSRKIACIIIDFPRHSLLWVKTTVSITDPQLNLRTLQSPKCLCHNLRGKILRTFYMPGVHQMLGVHR